MASIASSRSFREPGRRRRRPRRTAPGAPGSERFATAPARRGGPGSHDPTPAPPPGQRPVMGGAHRRRAWRHQRSDGDGKDGVARTYMGLFPSLDRRPFQASSHHRRDTSRHCNRMPGRSRETPPCWRCPMADRPGARESGPRLPANRRCHPGHVDSSGSGSCPGRRH